MSLRVRPDHAGGFLVDVTPESAGWGYVGFRVVRLSPGQSCRYEDAARECCVTVLEGTVSLQCAGASFTNVGTRASVFDPQAPAAAYVPPGQAIQMQAVGPALVAFSTAPATGKYPFRMIDPAGMKRSVRGKGTNTRHVCDILPETEAAESLLVVEVITPSSHSSSYPPHKHDTASDTETSLEETYFHMLNPPQGYAFQRVYTDDRSLDEALLLENMDTVLVPRGYHPCTVPHGYELYYLNTMAGPERRWAFTNDPAHEWIVQTTP